MVEEIQGTKGNRKSQGQSFLGFFCFFLDKESILLIDYIQKSQPNFLFLQDNAPAHKAGKIEVLKNLE